MTGESGGEGGAARAAEARAPAGIGAAAAERLAGADKIAVFTGAGVSTESGIPTFRGKGGLWRSYDPMELATIGAFERNPRLVWEWYEDRRANIRSAEPNAGHRAIAALEETHEVSVITQNIDGLHQRAGSTEVIELHGSIVRTRCSSCGAPDDADDGSRAHPALPPPCAAGCGGIMRPDVVWFGEALPAGALERAVERARACDAMIVAGTSLAVSPANMLPGEARACGAVIVDVNPERGHMSHVMDAEVRGRAADSLPRLAAFLARRSRARRSRGAAG